MAETRAGLSPGPQAGQEPYGLARMLEDTVTAPFRAGTVFASLGERPAPSYAVMIPNLLAFCAAAYAANLLRSSIITPEPLASSPAVMAIAAAAGLVLIVPLSFVAAGILHVFMLLSGAEGDFQRSYQASSMLSWLVTLQSLLNRFDWVWTLPALLAAYLAAAAAKSLHRAPAARAGVVFGVVAAAGISGQWWLREQVSRWSQTARAIDNAATAAQDLGRQLQQLQQMAASVTGGVGGPDRGAPQEQPQATWGAALSSSPQPTAVSGLQLLSPPQSGPAGAPDGPQLRAQAQAQGQAIQQATSNLMDPIMAMLSNPALTRGMPPEQAKQMKALTSLLGQMQAGMSSGKKPTPEEQAAMMAQFQASLMQFMTKAGAPKKKATGSTPPLPAQTPETAPR